jgi:hypothetical protein
MVDPSAWDDTASAYRDDAGRPPEEQEPPAKGILRAILTLISTSGPNRPNHV